MAVPLTIAVLQHRSVPVFSTANELGMLAAGVLLLASGFMFQIRSTTLTGAALLAVYLVSLVLYINMLQHVQTAAIWMTIGGGRDLRHGDPAERLSRPPADLARPGEKAGRNFQGAGLAVR